MRFASGTRLGLRPISDFIGVSYLKGDDITLVSSPHRFALAPTAGPRCAVNRRVRLGALPRAMQTTATMRLGAL